MNATDITLSDLEQAINYWRGLRPSRGEERALSPEVNQLRGSLCADDLRAAAQSCRGSGSMAGRWV